MHNATNTISLLIVCTLFVCFQHMLATQFGSQNRTVLAICPPFLGFCGFSVSLVINSAICPIGTSALNAFVRGQYYGSRSCLFHRICDACSHFIITVRHTASFYAASITFFVKKWLGAQLPCFEPASNSVRHCFLHQYRVLYLSASLISQYNFVIAIPFLSISFYNLYTIRALIAYGVAIIIVSHVLSF